MSRLQRQSAGRGRLSEVKDIAKRHVVRRAGEWWHGPDPEHGARHGTLQSDRQDAPPATRPSLRRRRPQRGWRAPGPEAQELTEEVMALITPATANLRSQDDKFLWAPPRELGIARSLAPTCCSERNPIAGICAGDRATGAGQGRHERRVCAQRLPIPRRSVDHKVEATAVIRRDLWGSGAGKPLLWHHASFVRCIVIGLARKSK